MVDTRTSLPESQINPEGFRASPNGHVYGLVADPEHAIPAVTADLLSRDIPLDGIHIYCCNEGLDALDLTGSRHGLRARINRMVQSVAYEDGHLHAIEKALEAGEALVGVAVDGDRNGDVARILHGHGGHDVIYYGDYTWQRLGPRGQTVGRPSARAAAGNDEPRTVPDAAESRTDENR